MTGNGCVSLRFERQKLFDVMGALRAELHLKDEIDFLVPNPDLGVGHYAGETVSSGAALRLHRPYRLWMDVAERLECHFLTPAKEGDMVRLRFARRPSRAQVEVDDASEKYGPESEFSRVQKLEEVCFLEDAIEALGRVKLRPGARILDLGVNTGEELNLLGLAFPDRSFDVLGIDHSASAIEKARERFPQYRFEVLDIRTLPRPELGKFDLIFSVGTLQSPGVNQDHVFRALLREHLLQGGAFVLGFPNCRYEDGDVTYGARMKNYRKPDLSLLVKDLAYYKRYFQRHDFNVFVTGKYYVFVTAFKSP